MLITLLFLTACGNISVSSKEELKWEEESSNDEYFELSADDFDRYFFYSIDDDFTYFEVGSQTKFKHALHIEIDSKVTASYDSIVIEGDINLPVEKTHLLYTEGKLPKHVVIRINGSGHGEEDVEIVHGEGDYGGFAIWDFYLDITSVSGKIKTDAE